MIKKPFFSFGKPRLKYPVIQMKDKEQDTEVPLPEEITLHLDRAYTPIDETVLKKGDGIKTGQRVFLNREGDENFISPVTGTVSEISEYIGYMSASQTSISIKTEEDQWDDEFKKVKGSVSRENAVKYMSCLPGCRDFASFINLEASLDTIVINGIDSDLLITTNQLISKTRPDALKNGLKYLKNITGVDKFIFIVPPTLDGKVEIGGAKVIPVDPVYPNSLPELVMKNVLNRIVPAGKSPAETGVGFINAEALAALSDAFGQGNAPVFKIISVINKEGSSVNVKARIGTPVKSVLDHLNLTTGDGDRLVLGGPLRGRSIYSEDTPVLYDTDGIMLQDKARIILTSDTPCINCGECVRACPSNIPVNMLVRLLENSLL